jgi:hypothetical protein
MGEKAAPKRGDASPESVIPRALVSRAVRYRPLLVSTVFMLAGVAGLMMMLFAHPSERPARSLPNDDDSDNREGGTGISSKRPPDRSRYLDLDALDWGSTRFSSPEELGYEETRTIEAVVSATHSVEQLAAQVDGRSAGQRIQIAPAMSAKLVGIAFDIVAATPEKQPVVKGASTRWQWDIRPKKETYDTQALTFSLWAHIEGNGGEQDYAVLTLKHDIKVRVTPVERAAAFVQGNWQWLWTTLLFPVMGWIYARRRPLRLRTQTSFDS